MPILPVHARLRALKDVYKRQVIVLGVLGAVFGLLLAFASRVFAVPVDERKSAISEILPGANCGGCGFAGCSAFANAVVEGNAPDVYKRQE